MIMTISSQSAPAAAFPWREAVGLKQEQQPEAFRLHAAVRRGCYTEAAALIAGGAELDRQDAGGETPLHLALRRADAAMTALLLMTGADAAQETIAGVAPRTIAREAGGGLLLRLIEAALIQQTFNEGCGLTTDWM